MMAGVDHIAGQTFHGRKGAVTNAFRYGVDYLLLDAEEPPAAPRLFSRNRGNLLSLWDVDHGGPPGAGRGAAWLREVLAQHGLPSPRRIELLAQPRVLGHVFNPVSFWLCHGDQGVQIVVAEVTARDHVQRILHKLAVPDRTAAAVLGLRLGLVD